MMNLIIKNTKTVKNKFHTIHIFQFIFIDENQTGATFQEQEMFIYKETFHFYMLILTADMTS